MKRLSLAGKQPAAPGAGVDTGRDKRLTDAEIREMLARAKAADGPRWCYIRRCPSEPDYCETITVREADGQVGVTILRHQAQWRIRAANRRFIVAARSDVPVLAHEVLALRVERDALRESLLEMTGDVEWLSGSSDYAPEGQANKGWRQVQIRLARALKLLEKKP